MGKQMISELTCDNCEKKSHVDSVGGLADSQALAIGWVIKGKDYFCNALCAEEFAETKGAIQSMRKTG